MAVSTKRRVLIGAGASVLALALFFFIRARLAPNPHMVLGDQDLEAGNYADAVSQFRLCIAEDPDNQRFKGLLAYSVVRERLEDSSRDEDTKADDELLLGFLRGYEMDQLDRSLDLFRGDSKKQVEEQVKAYRKSLRDLFTKNRLSFRDWSDVNESVASAAGELYRLKPGLDNVVDERGKDIAAAVLAKGGDAGARDFLLKRCATNPGLLPLTLVVGDDIKAGLKSESTNKESFIGDESTSALRLLEVKPELRKLASLDDSFRMAKRADLPKDQRDLLDEKPVPLLGADEAAVLLALDALREQKADPSAFTVKFVNGDDDHFVLLSTYSGKEGRFRCRVLAWNGDGYKTVPVGPSGQLDLVGSLPTGRKAAFDADKKELRIGVEKFQTVSRTKTENQTRPVTRYRLEDRYDPSANSGYGGIVQVQIPYTDFETVPEATQYTEPARGCVWHVYTWQRTAQELTPVRTIWVDDAESYEDVVAREAKEVATEKLPIGPIGAAAPEKSAAGDRVETLANACLTRPVAVAELSSLGKGELRLVRNWMFARKGYIFKSPDLRAYFGAKSWYTPTTTNVDVIMSTMTPNQRANIGLIKQLEK